MIDIASSEVRTVQTLIKTPTQISNDLQKQNDDVDAILSPKQLETKLKSEQRLLEKLKGAEWLEVGHFSISRPPKYHFNQSRSATVLPRYPHTNEELIL